MNEDRIEFATVVVTYGSENRFDNLCKTMWSSIKGGSKKIYLVDNGCVYDLRQKVAREFRGFSINIISFDNNRGSLVGFSSGIKAALKDTLLDDNDFILILDDDVILDRDFKKKFVRIDKKVGQSTRHIWSLFRQGRDHIFDDNYDKSINYYRNSIAGFSVFRRKAKSETVRTNDIAKPFFIPWAGTFIRKSDFKSIELPTTSYFVYEDDAEFSLNVRECGFEIFRSSELKLNESSNSWFEEGSRSQSGYKLFYDKNVNPARFLYKIRNNTFLIRNRLTTNKVMFYVNILVFVVAGFIRYGKPTMSGVKRLNQLWLSIYNGLHGKLGENKHWQL